jgi:GNAT superfamily N-acetyltransferase
MSAADTSIRLRHVLEPGDLGMIVYLHGVVYAREYGLDTTFEPYVAKPLAEFAIEGVGRLWVAEKDGSVIGSIAMVDAGPDTGQLRWFLLAPQARGLGLGRRLLDAALDYARERGFAHVFLWSFTDLHDAIRLYQKAGFRVTETETGEVWGAERTQVRMDLDLHDGGPEQE